MVRATTNQYEEVNKISLSEEPGSFTIILNTWWSENYSPKFVQVTVSSRLSILLSWANTTDVFNGWMPTIFCCCTHLLHFAVSFSDNGAETASS